MGALLLGVIHSAQHIGRSAGGGNAHQHVLASKADFLQILRAKGFVVLRAFLCPENRLVSAGDQADHLSGIGRVSGRAFHGVQNAQTSGRAAAAVHQPSALLQLGGDHIHRLSDVFGLVSHCRGDLFIFFVDQLHHAQRTHGVDLCSPAVTLFCLDRIEIHIVPPVTLSPGQTVLPPAPAPRFHYSRFNRKEHRQQNGPG